MVQDLLNVSLDTAARLGTTGLGGALFGGLVVSYLITGNLNPFKSKNGSASIKRDECRRIHEDLNREIAAGNANRDETLRQHLDILMELKGTAAEAMTKLDNISKV